MRQYEAYDFLGENRLSPRSYYIPFDSLDAAKSYDRTASPYFKLLNGTWQFRYYAAEEEADLANTSWDEVPVPSCWQTTGYEKPYYTNFNYPYPVDPPYVPDVNPCGLYRTEFSLTEKEAKDRTYIVFDGVASCLYLYVNGKYVGASTGNHLMAEFDLTPYVKKGKNVLIAKVLKWCSGSYLEDQDCFRMNGIFRDVYLLSREEGHLTDIEIKADEKTITVSAPDYEIFDAEGKSLGKNVKHPTLWNEEHPYLYTVVVKHGREYIPFRVGFRSIMTGKKGFLVNGVPVKLKGINRHDSHPETGWVMTDEEMKKELCQMKELNINCIRTSHYPPTPALLDAADEMGFYIVDEADYESHGFVSRKSGYDYDDHVLWPSHGPDWEKAMIYRVRHLVERDKNRASVVMWSIGNEGNYGINTQKMLDWIGARDNSRPRHYERATGVRDMAPVEVRSQMYPGFAEMDRIASLHDERPFFLCEYSASMGNGPGDTYDYVEKFYSDPVFIGGCSWEWADHVVMKDGVPCYGGDFGEETHDSFFCIDGIVFPDRSYKAATYQLKYAYQGFAASLSGTTLTLTNRFDFTDLSEYEMHIGLTVSGKTEKDVSRRIALAPHKTVTMALPFAIPKSAPMGAFVTLMLYDGDKLIGMKQLDTDCKATPVKTGKKLPVKDGGDRISVTCGRITYQISKVTGTIVSMKKGTTELLKEPVHLTVWRAPIDNDPRGVWNQDKLRYVHQKTYDYKVTGNKITFHGSLAPVSRLVFMRYTLSYEFFDDGKMKVALSGDIDRGALRESLPRLGFVFHFKKENLPFSYDGYGPYECYADLSHHVTFGHFESTAQKEFVNYPMPQEHGNHIGTACVSMPSVKVTSAEPFEFAVSEYSADTLTDAMHTNELEGKKDGTFLRIDYKDMGLGSASCGPRLPDRYRVPFGKIDFAFYLE